MRALGFRAAPAPVEEMARLRRAVARSLLVFEHIDRAKGRGGGRAAVRNRIARWGGKLIGAPPQAAARADDKIACKRRLLQAGVPVPKGRVVVAGRFLQRRLAGLPFGGVRFPLLLKRPHEHGSRGVWLIRRLEDLAAAEELAVPGERLLLEEYVSGCEVAASVIEIDGEPRCLPLVEVVLGKKRLYGRGLKWGKGSLPIRPARLSRKTEERARRTALRAFRALGLRDYARLDLRIDRRGIPRILEANVRPSVEPGTELVLSARLAGLSHPELVGLLIDSAARRHRIPRRLLEARL